MAELRPALVAFAGGVEPVAGLGVATLDAAGVARLRTAETCGAGDGIARSAGLYDLHVGHIGKATRGDACASGDLGAADDVGTAGMGCGLTTGCCMRARLTGPIRWGPD